ncbi:MAG: 50S ribosomal protein L15 [Anaerolineae bacterium]
MRLHDLRPAEGATKGRKRVGRGISAGQGKTSGRGTKGQNSRAGGAKPPYFEGGQLPIVRRLPWRHGFHSFTRVEYTPVNLARLDVFEAGSVVSPEALIAQGIIKKSTKRIKILGTGDITKALQVQAHGYSEAARAKIVAAGGQAEIIS